MCWLKSRLDGAADKKMTEEMTLASAPFRLSASLQWLCPSTREEEEVI